jgi:NADPH-dependent glutamate synthase beta subunit-like oxidoreductase
VEVERGATILDAARKLGIEIPTLCHADGVAPFGSCFLCVVRVEGRRNLVPSCVAPAEDGMVVTTQSDEIRAARRTALELLFSDHVGDCVAPCTLACPAGMDIPAMIRRIREGDPRGALEVIRERIPFAGVLGRICPRYCERVCRRGELDQPIAICALKRFPADVALAAGDFDLPPKKSPTGKKVAIVGAGPAGLSAAFYLLREGHACTIFDAGAEPGGLLRYAVPESRLPKRVLEAEIAVVRRLGADFRLNQRLGENLDFEKLRREHDAVFLALGAAAEHLEVTARRADTELFKRLGLNVSGHGIAADRHTLATNLDGVFAGGECVSVPGAAVRAVAAGRLAAVSIGQFLRGESVVGERKFLHVLMGTLSEAEHAALFRDCVRGEKRPTEDEIAAGLSDSEAVREARRCIQCDCLAKDTCGLRRYGTEYAAEPGKYKGERRAFARDASHPEIVYESGKCILCGLCVRIAEQEGERPGITFEGRGFPTVAAIPFDRPVAEGLARTGARCAAACPTGALALKAGLDTKGRPC